jgi:hypothetical protein
MKKLFLVLALLTGLAVRAQHTVVVEKIVFTSTVDKESISDIPYVKDPAGRQNQVTEKINAAIQDRFMFDSFDPKSVTSFYWYGVEFTHQIAENVLHIAFQGEYYGAYLNNVEDHLYFDLKTGDQLDEKLVPFHALFSPEGYFDFLNKYWLPRCAGEFKEATRCAESEPYCSCYDIDFAHTGSQLVLSLTNDCFPHASRACSPSVSEEIRLDTIKPFLSSFGNYVLLESRYGKLSRLEQFLFTRKHLGRVPNYCYAVGRIDDKYGFSMALQLPQTNSDAVVGYYFYGKKKIKIPLSGKVQGQHIVLAESVDGKITGRFEFTWHDDYQEDGIAVGEKYLTGRWTNAQNGKVLKITFLDYRSNQ